MDVGACFFINLDHRADRRCHMEAQGRGLGDVPLERWPGVRATDRNLRNTWEAYTRSGLAPYLYEYRRQGRTRERFYGILGCYFSHIQLMEHVADRFAGSDDNVLVFEDDVVIERGFLDRLRERFEDPVLRDADWDIVRIDCWGDRVEEFRVSDHIYRLTRPWETRTQFGGTHATLYRPPRLPKILDILASTEIRDFDGMWSYGGLPDLVEHYVVDTGLCGRNHTLGSDIRPQGVHRLRWKLRRMFAAR